MIVSHALKLIFIKPRKVAGTSLEIALSKFAGPDDVITPIIDNDEQSRRAMGYRGPQHYHTPFMDCRLVDWARFVVRGQRPKRFYNHMSASEISKVLPSEIWNSYTKVSIVRNPFDRVISKYFWLCQTAGLEIEFNKWLIANPSAIVENRDLTHINGVSVVDVMLRYEHFDEDLSVLSDRLGLAENLSEIMRGIHAKSGIRKKKASSQEMFAGFDEGVELINILCRDEIAEYGYDLRMTSFGSGKLSKATSGERVQ